MERTKRAHASGRKIVIYDREGRRLAGYLCADGRVQLVVDVGGGPADHVAVLELGAHEVAKLGRLFRVAGEKAA
jgi:hypothetical protein